MTRSMRPRDHATAPKRDRADAAATALERMPITATILEQMQPLSADAVTRSLTFAARLPERLRMQVLRVIANKLAADFALSYLPLLEDTLNDQPQRPLQERILNLQDTDDAKLTERLLELWAEIPRHLDVRGDASFERFARATAGLRMLVEATPDDAREAWVFDSGSEYCAMLTQTGVLPVFVVSGDGANGALHVIQFAGSKPGAYAFQVSWAAPRQQSYMTKPLEISAPALSSAQATPLAS